MTVGYIFVLLTTARETETDLIGYCDSICAVCIKVVYSVLCVMLYIFFFIKYNCEQQNMDNVEYM